MKRFVTQSPTRSAPTLSAPALRRSLHTSVYDKNVEDNICPAVVPDITQPEPDKFWAPNPNNGVFGPAAEHNSASGIHASTANGGIESVLEVKTFFRSLEDLEKPQHP